MSYQSRRERMSIVTLLRNTKKILFKHILLYTFLFFIFSLQAEPQRKWTFIVYMAADNDLRGFAIKNIKQMAQVGSTEHITILIHLDIKLSGNQKITKRYLVEKGQLVQDNDQDSATQSMDSGDPATLVSCCKWAIENYPADDYGLIFWNHGSGPLDPERGKILNPIELFVFNPETRKLEIDRSIGYFDLLAQQKDTCWYDSERGICWDDTTGNYLTNQKLESALKTICTLYLNGGKFSLIGFDACLMASIEISNIIQHYAHYMTASEEVELGAGLNYTKVLAPFVGRSLKPDEFAKHIVQTYYDVYSRITDDFTHSALDLSKMSLLEQNVDTIAQLLIYALQNQLGTSVKDTITRCISKTNCTHFSEPTYLDLHDIYRNLSYYMDKFVLVNPHTDALFKQNLKHALASGMELFTSIVLANVAGPNLSNAKGISIYFPDGPIHKSYSKTNFARDNNWYQLLRFYLKESRDLDLEKSDI